jgi:F-type H+-transporting ATPase subunit epsilon
MTAFTVTLQSASRSDVINDVTAFVGEDASGSFGIRAGHARFMTLLVVGLARLRRGDEPWRYLAVPGAVVYFHNNELVLSTRRYLLGDNYNRISEALRQELLVEEDKLQAMKQSLHNMEGAILKRLWELGRRDIA